MAIYSAFKYSSQKYGTSTSPVLVAVVATGGTIIVQGPTEPAATSIWMEEI